MFFLSKYPSEAEKLRKEVKNVLGDRDVPSYSDIKDLKYCELFLKEVLRMRPPVPLLAREIKSDTIFGSQTYRAGVSKILRIF